jgi:hypothetical protein
MAVTSYAVSLVNNRLRNQINDQIQKCCRLMQYMLKKDGCVVFNEGGDSVEFYVRYRASGNGARAIGDFTQPQAETLDDFQKLTVAWARYGRALATSKFQEKRAQNAKDANKNFDFIARQLDSFRQAFKETLATDMYGSGTRSTSRNDVGDPILGLDHWIDDDNTSCGIVRSTDTWFKAQLTTVTDFFGDDILSDECNGLKTMRQYWNKCSVGSQNNKQGDADVADSREQPDLTLCDQTSYEKYENSLHGRDKITIDGADASYKTLTFMRKPIDWDSFAAANRMSFINLAWWHLYCTESANQMVNVYGEDSAGIVKSMTLATQLALFCKKPAAQGAIDISG